MRYNVVIVLVMEDVEVHNHTLKAISEQLYVWIWTFWCRLEELYRCSDITGSLDTLEYRSCVLPFGMIMGPRGYQDTGYCCRKPTQDLPSVSLLESGVPHRRFWKHRAFLMYRRQRKSISLVYSCLMSVLTFVYLSTALSAERFSIWCICQTQFRHLFFFFFLEQGLRNEYFVLLWFFEIIFFFLIHDDLCVLSHMFKLSERQCRILFQNRTNHQFSDSSTQTVTQHNH
jgi:hypothetical protein